MGLYAGARKSAELDIQWRPNNVAGHVNLARRTFNFNGKRPTTKKRRPIAVVSQRLRCFLPHWRKKRVRYVIERNGKKLGDVKRGFASACRAAAREFYHKAMEAKKRGDHDARHECLESAARLRSASPNILRHTCITWLLQADYSCWEVGKFVGDTEATIQRVYGHHCPSHQARIAGAF
jgi:integrase